MNQRRRFTWNPKSYPRIHDFLAAMDLEDWLWDHNAPPVRNSDGTVAFEFFPRFPPP